MLIYLFLGGLIFSLILLGISIIIWICSKLGIGNRLNYFYYVLYAIFVIIFSVSLILSIISFFMSKPRIVLGSDVPLGRLSAVTPRLSEELNNIPITLDTTSGITSGTTSGITSDTTSGITSGTTSGITSDTTSGITSGTTSGITSDTTSGITSGTTSGITSGTTSGITSDTTSGITSGTTSGTPRPTGTSGLTPTLLDAASSSSSVNPRSENGIYLSLFNSCKEASGLFKNDTHNNPKGFEKNGDLIYDSIIKENKLQNSIRYYDLDNNTILKFNIQYNIYSLPNILEICRYVNGINFNSKIEFGTNILFYVISNLKPLNLEKEKIEKKIIDANKIIQDAKDKFNKANENAINAKFYADNARNAYIVANDASNNATNDSDATTNFYNTARNVYNNNPANSARNVSSSVFDAANSARKVADNAKIAAEAASLAASNASASAKATNDSNIDTVANNSAAVATASKNIANDVDDKINNIYPNIKNAANASNADDLVEYANDLSDNAKIAADAAKIAADVAKNASDAAAKAYSVAAKAADATQNNVSTAISDANAIIDAASKEDLTNENLDKKIEYIQNISRIFDESKFSIIDFDKENTPNKYTMYIKERNKFSKKEIDINQLIEPNHDKYIPLFKYHNHIYMILN